MAALPVVLLPGLDGTGDLCQPLVDTAPAHLPPIVISLPLLGSYDALLPAVRAVLPPNGRFAIVGESFSGPLALRIASELPDRVTAVILCNSFVIAPITGLFRFLPWSLLFALPLPRWVVRMFFVGVNAPRELVDAVRDAVAKTPRRVLGARMRAVFALPHVPAARIDAPLLLLAGTGDLLVRVQADAVRAIASRVKVAHIRGPHLLLQANPVDAWKAIDSFLLDLPNPSRVSRL